MRAASAGPMPGSFSNSSREARLIETGAESSARVGTWEAGTRARRGNLTQAEATAADAQHRMIQPRRFFKRFRATAGRCLPGRLRDVCRASVQNARSLKSSGTCNFENQVIHRLFHRTCGKVVESLSAKERRKRLEI
jgi:hypothetical protein